MKTGAIRIHALARSLAAEKARVVVHDIGLMVAYAHAAQFPAEVEKLVVMDAFLPGVGGWEAVYGKPIRRPTPERDACGLAGLTSFRSREPRGILPNSPRPS